MLISQISCDFVGLYHMPKSVRYNLIKKVGPRLRDIPGVQSQIKQPTARLFDFILMDHHFRGLGKSRSWRWAPRRSWARRRQRWRRRWNLDWGNFGQLSSQNKLNKLFNSNYISWKLTCELDDGSHGEGEDELRQEHHRANDPHVRPDAANLERQYERFRESRTIICEIAFASNIFAKYLLLLRGLWFVGLVAAAGCGGVERRRLLDGRVLGVLKWCGWVEPLICLFDYFDPLSPFSVLGTLES